MSKPTWPFWRANPTEVLKRLGCSLQRFWPHDVATLGAAGSFQGWAPVDRTTPAVNPWICFRCLGEKIKNYPPPRRRPCSSDPKTTNGLKNAFYWASWHTTHYPQLISSSFCIPPTTTTPYTDYLLIFIWVSPQCSQVFQSRRHIEPLHSSWTSREVKHWKWEEVLTGGDM